MLLVGLMVKLTSKGPILYCSDRVGIRRQRSEVSGQWSERNSGWNEGKNRFHWAGGVKMIRMTG